MGGWVLLLLLWWYCSTGSDGKKGGQHGTRKVEILNFVWGRHGESLTSLGEGYIVVCLVQFPNRAAKVVLFLYHDRVGTFGCR